MRTLAIKYNSILTGYFVNKPLYLDLFTRKQPNIRKLVEQPFQQTKAQLWEEVTITLCNLDFIQAKSAAKMTYDLVNDFNAVLQVMPDNTDVITEENLHLARMNKYTGDLIEYAKGEITEFEIPETEPLWSEEESNAEIERIKTHPTRLDLIKDFVNFLGMEAGNLHNYAHEIPHFVTQQAWNYADAGPVSKRADSASLEILKNLMLRSIPNRHVWNTLPQIIFTLRGHTDYIYAVAITPNGEKAISTSWDKTCILWNLKTGQAIQVLKGHTEIIHAVAITPDGTKAITGSGRPSFSESDSSADNDCILWDLNTGRAISTLKGHTREVVAVAMTSDGKKAVSGSKDKTCIVWDLLTGQQIYTLKGHNSGVNAIDITPNGIYAISGSHDKTCIFWDITSGQAIKELAGHTSPVKAVALTPDGSRAISGSEDKSCILWDVKTGEPIFRLKGHTGSVNAVAITPNGKRAISGSYDKICIVWDLVAGQEINRLKGHANEIHAVAITADGKNAISGSNDKSSIFWALNNREAVNTLKGHTDEVLAISTFPGGKMAVTVSVDKTCIVWGIATALIVRSLIGHTYWVHAIAVTPDCNRAISGSWRPIIGSWDKTCIIWNLKTGQEICGMKEHPANVNAITITPDGKKAVSASHDMTCIIWDMVTGQSIHTLFGHTLGVNTVAITPDGKRVVSGSEAFNDGTKGITLIIWDINTGQVIKASEGYSNVRTLAITPDGKKAISDSKGGSFTLWDLRSRYPKKTLKGHTTNITDIVISPDGKRVISRSVDNTCIIWDLDSQKKLGLFVTAPNTRALSYFPGGVIGGDRSGNIFIINLSKELLCPQRCILTIKRIWDFELHRFLPLSADCPLCGHRFEPPALVLETIETITKKAGLSPEQSPCLELPEDAWEDPGLLGECPKCGGKLRFNPFVAGQDN